MNSAARTYPGIVCLQIHKRRASEQGVTFSLYMEALLKQRGCACFSHSLTDSTKDDTTPECLLYLSRNLPCFINQMGRRPQPRNASKLQPSTTIKLPSAGLTLRSLMARLSLRPSARLRILKRMQKLQLQVTQAHKSAVRQTLQALNEHQHAAAVPRASQARR